MRILAFDIGKRRTGVAFLDEATGVPLPLDTLKHASTGMLLEQIVSLITARKIDRVIVGLPLLLSGKEGSQAAFVRSVAEKIHLSGTPVTFLDERYSNDRGIPRDKDAFAAWNLLQTAHKG